MKYSSLGKLPARRHPGRRIPLLLRPHGHVLTQNLNRPFIGFPQFYDVRRRPLPVAARWPDHGPRFGPVRFPAFFDLRQKALDMRLLRVWVVRILILWLEVLLTLPLGRLDLDSIHRFHNHVAAALRLITAMIK